MQKTWIVAGLLGAIALAGCLNNEPDAQTNIDPFAVPGCEIGTTDADGVNLVDRNDYSVMPPLLEDKSVNTEAYDYWDFDLTNYRTCTLEKVGHTPLRFNEDGTGNPHRYLGELDMRGDLNLGAVQVNGNGEAPMVYLLDITDRANPIVLSVIQESLNYVVDVKISDDGNYLFTASQYSGSYTPDENSAIPTGISTPNGFSIYDISNRENPSYLQTVSSPDGLGCHMLSHEIIDGTDFVFCVGDSIHAYGLVRSTDGAPWAVLGRFTYNVPNSDATTSASPVGCANESPAGEVPQTGNNFCSGPHDMTVGVDAVDGRVLMAASHWDEGLRIVDASAPVDEGFTTLASWTGEGATYYDGNVHTAMIFWVGDKRYVAATPEMTYGGVVPSMWILDATDLGDGSEIIELELIAEWFHPIEYKTPGLIMTTHQWQVAPTGPDANVEDTNVYITMNHLGVWVLDFAEILAGNNADAIGGFHMSREPLDPAEESGAAVYSTWDVGVVDGYIYGTDRATGLWVFDYTGDVKDDTSIRGFA
jgi:hypothetical protein